MDDKDFLKKFGMNLKIQRLKQGYTQEVFAEMANMHEKHIGKIETGNQNITLKTINRLANALKIDAVKFFDFD